MFSNSKLISLASKRQETIAMSTTEAEYILAASGCTQLLWMKHQLEDYQISANSIPIICDNMLLFVCQRIQFYIQEPSTFKSNTIL